MQSKKLFFMVFLLVSTFGAYGQIIDVEVTAQVSEIDDMDNVFGEAVGVDDELLLTYSFDTDADNLESGDRATYFMDNLSMQVNLSSYEFQSQAITIIVANNRFGEDFYMVTGTENFPVNGLPTFEYTMYLHLGDASSQVIDNTSINQNIDLLEGWTSANIYLQGHDRGSIFYITSDVTDIQIVPEPTTIALMGSGVWGILRKNRA
ncbi:PEP-CTERM sorting domain-containing protein [Sedimentisphaera salicampi]|uniref:PEP-CTERM sorting domain-containing protein n=1 Tax=Sedimentisphaera salicampi TaxID=1941349 RepID=UPI000B9C2FDE|nr:PEP-CTERM sorting domain-containing protein [Sedimentisphaera salicampi]OXU14510.1 hypothetical protein SMSP1_01821 [Sedimentisphaera salicampi]